MPRGVSLEQQGCGAAVAGFAGGCRGTGRMKVAIIDPSGSTLPYDHCLATALAQHRCQVALVTTRLRPGPWSQGTLYEPWEHFYRTASRLTKTRVRTYAKGCQHILDMERLAWRLQRWEPDVIHFQWIPLPAVDALFLRRLRRIAPLVVTVHDTQPYHGAPSSRFQLIGLLSALRHFDRYIVHTEYSKRALQDQLAVPDHRVAVIPHGVLAYYREMATEPAGTTRVPHPATKKVLFLGGLKPYKGVDVLLEAFARLREPLASSTILQIVGDPERLATHLQYLARHLGIENRVFWDLRFVSESEVASYFAQADVIVLPYRRIDQSGVLMVALAFGKPIVASRVGGFAEVLTDGVHGFLVEPGDVESLARALERILGDDAMRARMALAVQELASGQLSWDSVAAKTLAVYEALQK